MPMMLSATTTPRPSSFSHTHHHSYGFSPSLVAPRVTAEVPLPNKRRPFNKCRHQPISIHAVAKDDLQTEPATQSDKLAGTGTGTGTYRFVVANAKFMLDEEEHFMELMFERRRNFQERNKEMDFWLVIEPKFLDNFPEFTKRLKRPAVALVSTNGPWITFMKLRLDRVLEGQFEAKTLEEALASTPTDLHFQEPNKWTAPYPKYESGWWKNFLPPGSE